MAVSTRSEERTGSPVRGEGENLFTAVLVWSPGKPCASPRPWPGPS